MFNTYNLCYLYSFQYLEIFSILRLKFCPAMSYYLNQIYAQIIKVNSWILLHCSEKNIYNQEPSQKRVL